MGRISSLDVEFSLNSVRFCKTELLFNLTLVSFFESLLQ
jgi:hypothetical protein